MRRTRVFAMVRVECSGISEVGGLQRMAMMPYDRSPIVGCGGSEAVIIEPMVVVYSV